ncbi:unnamed protein product [Rotaria sordida]|uniref:Uncharacterized protein n=1 Tax=Rotaria sordida TaxID=392033 RepID=A0A814CWD7_9BILA|nr:unnamed protein product [Rotaria sordida]CAF3972094.1 unnamed protein product [Rotaria sordida]
MCREMSNGDVENTEEVYEVAASSITYKINRESLISLIKCAIGDTSRESLINPMVAVKIIGLVANASVREWYKATITNQPIIPFNHRTKSIDEIIGLLEQHYDLKSIMMD